MSKIDEMQSDIELKAFFIQKLENKIALLERKLELCKEQRNYLVGCEWWAGDERDKLDKELEELK